MALTSATIALPEQRWNGLRCPRMMRIVHDASSTSTSNRTKRKSRRLSSPRDACPIGKPTRCFYFHRFIALSRVLVCRAVLSHVDKFTVLRLGSLLGTSCSPSSVAVMRPTPPHPTPALTKCPCTQTPLTIPTGGSIASNHPRLCAWDSFPMSSTLLLGMLTANHLYPIDRHANLDLESLQGEG